MICLAGLLIAAAANSPAAGSQNRVQVQVLRGRIEAATAQAPQAAAAETGLFVTEDGLRQTVTGDEYTMGQLHDRRLAGRLWELHGTPGPGGRFVVDKLFTIKDRQRFRVTYFCVVYNIRTHAPGRCMCCQDETELEEAPEKP